MIPSGSNESRLLISQVSVNLNQSLHKTLTSAPLTFRYLPCQSAYRHPSRASVVYRTRPCDGAVYPVPHLRALWRRASHWKLRQFAYRFKIRNTHPHLAASCTHDYATALSLAPSIAETRGSRRLRILSSPAPCLCNRPIYGRVMRQRV